MLPTTTGLEAFTLSGTRARNHRLKCILPVLGSKATSPCRMKQNATRWPCTVAITGAA